MKLYILVLDDVPDNFVPVITAHASLIAHLKWDTKEEAYPSKPNFDYQKWLETSFRKCVVSVNQKEFSKAKTFENVEIITESALEGREVALVLCPREEFPKAVKFYKLWKPKS